MGERGTPNPSPHLGGDQMEATAEKAKKPKLLLMGLKRFVKRFSEGIPAQQLAF